MVVVLGGVSGWCRQCGMVAKICSEEGHLSSTFSLVYIEGCQMLALHLELMYILTSM